MLRCSPLICRAAALSALTTGCSFDYGETSLDDELASQVPNSVLRVVEHTVIRGDRVSVILEAEMVEAFDNRNVTLLHEVYFREFDDAGVVVTEAWADRGVFHTDTDDAEVTGSVVLSSRREDAEVFADELSWQDGDRILKAGTDGEVVMRRADGSRVTGSNFEADIGHRIIRFRSAVAGTLVVDE